jgi:hypothetical protein
MTSDLPCLTQSVRLPFFGESSSGSDYDTEEALSQPTTDDGSVDPVEEATVPSRQVPRRDRDQSPVTVRYGSPQRPAPRRPRDHSPVSVRYVASQVRGPDGRHQQTQLCLNRDCTYPARVWQNFRFCSLTCGKKVRGSFWFGAWRLTHPFVCWFVADQRRGIPD